MRRERIDHTLQPTALVHEAYIKLIQQHLIDWQSRANFFGSAAQVMRRILVDHARGHLREKRGEGRGRFQSMRPWRSLPNNLESFLNWTKRWND